MKILTVVKWSATILTISGAILLSFNLDISKYAFIILLGGSLLWVAGGVMMKESSIWVLNVFFIFVYLNSMYNWIIK